ncbi:MAG: integrase [Prochlorococcaceae cyanobacterium]
MPASADPWLRRQNAALKLRGLAVSLELGGARLRLRASMPPKPGEPPDTPWQQQRISTGLEYPARATEGVELAETLGRALERARLELEPFDWGPWERLGRGRGTSTGQGTRERVSGLSALSMTRQWWEAKRSRGRSAEDSWDVDYRQPLSGLTAIQDLQPAHLQALVDACAAGSRSRLRAGRAVATMAEALGWSAELIADLRQRGKGYSARKASPRDLPSDRQIEQLIDDLAPEWQWPVAVVATYGCRPHEALLHAEVQPSGLLRIHDGKTGARQSLALPADWLQRWNLTDRRLPRTMHPERGHRAAGMAMGRLFRRVQAGMQPYDLRHAWAVRAIHNPRISPSLAAKSMGHSLAVHSSIYQRWFDAHEMASLQSELSAAT